MPVVSFDYIEKHEQMADEITRLRAEAAAVGAAMERRHLQDELAQASAKIVEQADTITTLRAEVERLGNELFSAMVADMKVVGEVERLRAALEKINVGEGWAAQIARAALQQKETSDDAV